MSMYERKYIIMQQKKNMFINSQFFFLYKVVNWNNFNRK